MKPKVTVLRALTARLISRMTRLVTLVATIVIFLLFIGIWALAHYLSAWWWLLVIPLAWLVLAALAFRLILVFISHRLYATKLSNVQRRGLDDFIAKVMDLAEKRSTPPIWFAFICLKDILFHRDITTVKTIMNDSASLKRDFASLETLFQ